MATLVPLRAGLFALQRLALERQHLPSHPGPSPIEMGPAPTPLITQSRQRLPVTITCTRGAQDDLLASLDSAAGTSRDIRVLLEQQVPQLEQLPLARIGRLVPHIRGDLAIISATLALVGKRLTLVRKRVPAISQPFPLVQPPLALVRPPTAPLGGRPLSSSTL